MKGKIKRKTNEIAGLKKKKDVSEKLEKSLKEVETLKEYSQTIQDLLNLTTKYAKPKTGKGIIYKEPKRNAYKIQFRHIFLMVS